MSIKTEIKLRRFFVNPLASLVYLIIAYLIISRVNNLETYFSMVVFLGLYGLAAFVIYVLEILFMNYTSDNGMDTALGGVILVSVIVFFTLLGTLGTGFISGIIWDYIVVCKTITILVAIISFSGMSIIWWNFRDRVPIYKYHL